MPIPRRRRAPRKARRAPKKGLRRAGKRKMGSMSPNRAIITETIDFGEFESNNFMNASLQISSFPRALEVGRGFKYYKLKSIEWIYTPDANTFQGGGAEGKPYLYYVMNRSGADTILPIDGMESMGAVPISFTKPVNIRYTPNLVQVLNVNAKAPGNGSVNQAIGNTPVFNRWLATQYLVSPSYIDTPPITDKTLSTYNFPTYYGHSTYVVQTGGTNTVGYYSVKAVWEFKEPQVWNCQTSVSN